MGQLTDLDKDEPDPVRRTANRLHDLLLESDHDMAERQTILLLMLGRELIAASLITKVPYDLAAELCKDLLLKYKEHIDINSTEA